MDSRFEVTEQAKEEKFFKRPFEIIKANTIATTYILETGRLEDDRDHKKSEI